MKKKSNRITTSSTAEYFAKNLQQVGFSSPTKAVLTTLKESVDNSLDACEENKILPNIKVTIKKIGRGALRNTDRIQIIVQDNGPGIDIKDVPKVFGEYLASSKFGRGRCSRGQQGIGISAATTWAIQTTAHGAKVITKRAGQRKAVSCIVATDLKKNKGIIKEREAVNWDEPHGTIVDFKIDGRIQLNGENGILNYLRGNVLLNPHMTLTYDLPDLEPTTIERVTNDIPVVPQPTAPHPHTMKLGEFITHARLFGQTSTKEWLRKGFSRVSDKVVSTIITNAKLPKSTLTMPVSKLTDDQFRKLFTGVQATDLMAPPTTSVMSIGEDALALSIQRLGEVDYFSVVSRKPAICDFKPVQIEVALARLKERSGESDQTVQVLRFANRVPLQFDKASCAIVKAINSINWKTYGLRQTRGQLPLGPYIIAVSMVSPFIKFKNASKETIDASDELVEEIRRALMKAGQRLSRHLRREHKAEELESKLQHIEKFSPILVTTLVRILKASEERRDKAEEGLKKILGRDTKETEKQLNHAESRLNEHLQERKKRLSSFKDEDKKLRSKEEEKKAQQAEEKASDEEADIKVEKSTRTSKSIGEKTSKKKTAKKTLKKSTKKVKKKPLNTAKKAKPKKSTAKKKKSKAVNKKPKKVAENKTAKKTITKKKKTKAKKKKR